MLGKRFNRGLVRTGVWRGVLKSPLSPPNCSNKQKILEKGTFIFCAKPWYAPNPGSKEIDADFLRKTADFLRFTPSPGASSTWRTQETAETHDFRKKPQNFAENCKKPQMGVRLLRSLVARPCEFSNRAILSL